MANILIMDDDAGIRLFLEVYLLEAGHEVRHANNGQEGLDMMEQAIPDLVILDINMPVMDGTHVMKAMRASAATGKVPVIALSAIVGLEIRDDMHNLGCDAYVEKPINIALLMAQIDSLIA